MKCIDCGKEITDRGEKAKRCKACFEEMHRKRSLDRYHIMREEKKATRVIKCEVCGKEMVGVHAGTKYCPECAKAVWKQAKKERDKRYEKAKAQRKREAKNREIGIVPKPKPKHAKTISIEKIALMALQNGTSYGKFVGRMEGRK